MKSSSKYGMHPLRLAVAHTVMAVIVGASVFNILTFREMWPFSSYQMYSKLRNFDTPLIRLRLFGVTQEAVPREIPLYNPRYLAPFDHARFARALTRLQEKGVDVSLWRRVMANAYERYEDGRLRGRHDGPKLQAMRLYELTWRLDPQAANKDRPENRRLLAVWQAGEPVDQ